MVSGVVFDERLTRYNFGESHPMAPVRVELTMLLADSLGLFDSDVLLRPAEGASDELLGLIHDQEYIDTVKRLGSGIQVNEPIRGLGTEDNPIFPAMHEASALIAGASVEAARLVFQGEVSHAINVSGGLHHAMPGSASGFCVYNDVALAIAWLLSQGEERVAYIDIDAHHGDGVQTIFYDDPRVLTISIHETPLTLFPGTGYPNEIGPKGAEGTSVNIALPPGTSDAGWLRAFNAVVPDVLRKFQPTMLVTQQGCDSHMDDPLTNLMLSVDGQRASYLALRDLADELCQGRWVAVGGGGYNVLDVVPRAWSHLIATVVRKDIDPSTETPDVWRQAVKTRSGFVAPTTMSDGRTPNYRSWIEGYDPASGLDRAILETRKEIFPYFGMDPYP